MNTTTDTLLYLQRPNRSTLQADIPLDGSKSISNRALLILTLAGANPADFLTHLSTSHDTTLMQALLRETGDVLDAGDAGTVFRFATAWLATRPGTQVLTGSARMRERPVGALVEALRQLGADIAYVEKEGYPPLRIGGPEHLGKGERTIAIQADVSSQFLSALLMIGPYLPNGLRLQPTGRLVSRPYVDMTVRLMQYFGAQVAWDGEALEVQPAPYHARHLRVEADWSAASYWYSMAAMTDQPDLMLRGLFADSVQGDSILAKMMERFGLHTAYLQEGIRISRDRPLHRAGMFEWNFLECPDIAQTLAVTCAGLGMTGVFSGLETLAIKETDRISALRDELAKVGVHFHRLPARFSKKTPGQTFYMMEGQAVWKETPVFATYGDHRMAMSFAPLGLLGTVGIEHPNVVRKSYPAFWQHLQQVGFVEQVATF